MIFEGEISTIYCDHHSKYDRSRNKRNCISSCLNLLDNMLFNVEIYCLFFQRQMALFKVVRDLSDQPKQNKIHQDLIEFETKLRDYI